MSPMIDTETVMDIIDTVVEKRGPEYIYPRWETLNQETDIVPDGCHYRWNSTDVAAGRLLDLDLVEGEPACLAGAVLAELGLLESLVSDAGDTAYDLANESAIQSLNGTDEVFTPEALTILAVGQARQDLGDSWGAVRDCMAERITDVRETYVMMAEAGFYEDQ